MVSGDKPGLTALPIEVEVELERARRLGDRFAGSCTEDSELAREQRARRFSAEFLKVPVLAHGLKNGDEIAKLEASLELTRQTQLHEFLSADPAQEGPSRTAQLEKALRESLEDISVKSILDFRISGTGVPAAEATATAAVCAIANIDETAPALSIHALDPERPWADSLEVLSKPGHFINTLRRFPQASAKGAVPEENIVAARHFLQMAQSHRDAGHPALNSLARWLTAAVELWEAQHLEEPRKAPAAPKAATRVHVVSHKPHDFRPLQRNEASSKAMPLQVIEREDPAWWWWMRLLLVAGYFLVAFWKACRYARSIEFWDRVGDVRKSFQRKWLKKQLTAVLPELSDNECEDSERCPDPQISERHKSYKMQLDGIESIIAYESLTQVIAPFCVFTVLLSLLRHEHMSLLYGDTNVVPMVVTGLLWARGLPPTPKLRLLIWLLLAAWFGYNTVRHLVDRNWLYFLEEVWLNHMVFVTMMSMALGLPRGLIVANMILHTAFFLSLSFSNDKSESSVSPSMQVLLVSIMMLCMHYSAVLSNIVSSKANVEYALVQAEFTRVKTEKRALDLEEEKARRDKELAEAQAKEALAQARAAEEGRRAVEANAKAIEKMHDALRDLLSLLCGAVVEIDSEMRLQDPGKLGSVLFQNEKLDLSRRNLTEFLSKEDVARFEKWVGTREMHENPISVTMVGSYSIRIRMTIYVAAIDHPGDVTTYVLGITESEDLEHEVHVTPPPAPPPTQDLPVFATGRHEQELPSVLESVTETPTPKAEGLGVRRDYDPIQAMDKEERMQSLLPLLWSWPLPESRRGGCCETHSLIAEAEELLAELRQIDCRDAPRCLVWQCPTCKLKGVPQDRHHYDAEQHVCARCAAWEMLF
ncbi:unnamed protein product [Symbiodinium sp. CCMP2592]|nr:unnamed protein product [Symbiodinium sp. CCMP2592]